MAVEEGEKKRADVRSVDVSIRHDDDFVVAQFFQVKAVSCRCRSQGLRSSCPLPGFGAPFQDALFLRSRFYRG